MEQAVAEAVPLGSFFLEELLSLISDEERELLLQSAVSILPLSILAPTINRLT